MDLYAVIKSEDEKTRKTLNRLEDTSRHQPDARRALLREVRARLQARRRLKETLLYPLLEDDPRSAETVRAARQRDAELAGLLDELQRTEPEDPRFQPRCEALNSVVFMHLEADDYEFLRRAAEVIPDEQAEELGDRADREVERLEQRLT